MTEHIIRLKPPPPKQKKRKQNPGRIERIQGFATHKWVLFVPYLIGFFVAAFTIRGLDYEYGRVCLTLAWLGMMAAGWIWGPRIRIYRKRFRPHPLIPAAQWRQVYQMACCSVLYGWSWWATARTPDVSPRDLAGLVICVTLLAAPWWYHRRIRGKVMVRFLDLPADERNEQLRIVKGLIFEWTAFTTAAKLEGARIIAITFDRWSIVIDITFRRGMHAGRMTARQLDNIGSAAPWRIPSGRVRVQGDPDDSQSARIRLMLIDPHENTMYADEDETPTPEHAVIGLFETGGDVLFELVNTLVAGETGAGKSTLMNRLIQIFSKISTIGILGVDGTAGATEFSPWRNVLAEIARNAEETGKLFDMVLAEFVRRGNIMSEKGWKTFHCTPRDPFILLLIDELTMIKRWRLHKKLAEIAEQIRKYGGAVIGATQYPKDDNVPTEVTANLIQKIGMMVGSPTADRVIFGDGATAAGWSPSVVIPKRRKGSFLIRNSFYHLPCLARCFAVPETTIEHETQRWGPQRTQIPAISLTAISAPPMGNPAELESAPPKGDGIVDAVLVPTLDMNDLIVESIAMGEDTPVKVQNYLRMYDMKVTRQTVHNRLRRLVEDGRIRQSHVRGPYVIVSREREAA